MRSFSVWKGAAFSPRVTGPLDREQRSSTLVERIILTASGGPFRETPNEEFAAITPEQALKHPTWNMGPKITIDSATLFNKGLEMIEAHWLFGVEMARVEVVIHPQSIVHSMVEFVDGSSPRPALAFRHVFPDSVCGHLAGPGDELAPAARFRGSSGSSTSPRRGWMISRRSISPVAPARPAALCLL